MTVDLLYLSTSKRLPKLSWPLGEVRTSPYSTAAVAAELDAFVGVTGADAVLFWDSELGAPNVDLIKSLLQTGGDLWHAGLKLGTAGLPGIIDFTRPTWMLNRDPDPDIDATSWRLSLRACLVRTDVLRRLRGLYPEFDTLDGAALEMGHRYISRGVLMRHVPSLVPTGATAKMAMVTPEDELRFAFCRFGLEWALWAAARAVATGYLSPSSVRHGMRQSRRMKHFEPDPLERGESNNGVSSDSFTVTVLIPTLERYPYLRKLLDQLRVQTVSPLEIIVVDQTPARERDASIEREFQDLPLRVLHLEQAGQSSSRNAGLQTARGDLILFIDDDDEVPANLVESHIRSLERYQADVSCGVAEEVDGGPLPFEFTFVRASDVFPTNNTMVRREALERSGLFDLAFDHGARADHDLGMRIYLSGCFMVLNPEISVLHHRAPRGGLRKHGARVVTRSSSRNRIGHRHLPSLTELYLARKYFSPRQVREMIWQRTAGTLRGDGSMLWRAIKAAFGLLALPDTVFRTFRRLRKADRHTGLIPRLERTATLATHENAG